MNYKNLQAAGLLLFSLSFLVQPALAQKDTTPMQTNFLTPPDSSKPGLYWYWLNGNISKEGVEKDLESMAKVGIGRAFIGNIGLGNEVPNGKVKMFTDDWWDVVRAAMKAGTKLGVDIGTFNSPGWSQSGGPWVKPTETMRYLGSSEVQVTGPKTISMKLATPGAYFQDVAVLAFPTKKHTELAQLKPVVKTSLPVSNTANMVDGDIKTESTFSADIMQKKEVTIDITAVKPLAAQSLLIYTSQNSISANAELQVRGKTSYKTVKKFPLQRHNSALNVGFTPYAPVVVSFAKVTGSKFRLLLTDINGGNSGIAEIKLTSQPYVESYPEKQLAKMFQTPLPLWNEYQWKSQPESMEEEDYTDPSEMINITSSLSKDGTLDWAVPKGNWTIVRYGMQPTGVTNSPAPAEGTGLEVDKMNSEALVTLFDSFVGQMIKKIPADERKSFKYVVADSYETGSQNWTDGLAGIFKEQYGYDPIPWLPVLTGRIVGSADESNRFLWDLRRLVADRVAYEYVGGLRELCHKNGLSLWLENYGHWGFPSEFLKYGGQSDEVGGEFWNEGDLGSIECKAASSAAHIYGKTRVSAESFTAGGMTYERYPALLKKKGDWSFTEGINNTILHVYITQAYPDKVPGINAYFGTEFNRNNTWFYQGSAFIDYIRRCNYVLQQGKPVNDVAYFIGEDAPKMTGVRNPELPKGYGYDYINAEVIETRLAVKDGKLVLPDSTAYRILVLPQLETMRPQLLAKIKELVNSGAVVLGPRPKRSPSLEGYGKADRLVQDMAAEIWGKVDGVKVKSGTYGKGRILSGLSMEEAFKLLNLRPDFYMPEAKPVLYTHRSTPESEIYFITNQSDSVVSFNPQFRTTGRQPEWWNPVNGNSRGMDEFTIGDGYTSLPVTLEAYQSGFIVFTKATGKASFSSKNFPASVTAAEITSPWEVKFDKEKRGPEKTVVFDKLIDWAKHTDENVKNYSGTAIYRTRFKAADYKGQKVYLNLGKVAVMAKVKLNGKDMGPVWTAPYRVNITSALKTGDNELEIEVVNTWVNRLIGDSKLPETERLTWSNVNPYNPQSTYQPSGLIGPVTLQVAK